MAYKHAYTKIGKPQWGSATAYCIVRLVLYKVWLFTRYQNPSIYKLIVIGYIHLFSPFIYSFIYYPKVVDLLKSLSL